METNILHFVQRDTLLEYMVTGVRQIIFSEVLFTALLDI